MHKTFRVYHVPKVWFDVRRRHHHDVTILAIHGGGIEPATSELALVTAQTNDYNFFHSVLWELFDLAFFINIFNFFYIRIIVFQVFK